MRCGKWIGGLVLGCWVVIACGGCVSMDQYRRLQAQNRRMAADKEALAQELYDMRNGSDSLHTRLSACEGEVATKDELIANLRSENDVLDEMRLLAQAELERLANKQDLSDVVIAGPKLPPQLDNALKRFADEHPSAVEYDSARGSVKWKSDLLFALGSDVVKESSQAALKRFTEIVKSPTASDFEVIVVGHTDNRPISRAATKSKHPTNWHLSAHRSISVANVLLHNGYDANRIGVMGCGEYRPVADNSTQQGRSQNRRVDIYLIPSGSIVKAAVGWRVEGEALAFARPVD
ncbi:MAG: OmpA family protein [Phycisphaerales bacterium]|nr:MAG: OmpA family protein [Phycisphaerales bacterium]